MFLWTAQPILTGHPSPDPSPCDALPSTICGSRRLAGAPDADERAQARRATFELKVNSMVDPGIATLFGASHTPLCNRQPRQILRSCPSRSMPIRPWCGSSPTAFYPGGRAIPPRTSRGRELGEALRRRASLRTFLGGAVRLATRHCKPTGTRSLAASSGNGAGLSKSMRR
jgi:hypothetical protein